MRHIKLRHIDTLAAFMKTGSVTEAAQVLHTTQPNASKSLKQLEDFAGIPLFQRIAGRLRPTPEAEILYAHARRLMDELTLFESLSSDLTNLKAGQVNIGTLSAFSTAVLPMAIESYNRQYPEVRVQVDLLDGDKIHNYISRGNYDFGLVHHPEHEPDLMAQTLATAQMVCLMSKDHPLAQYKVIMASDLIGRPFVTYPQSVPFGAAIFRTLSDAGVRPSGMLLSNQSQMIRRLVERGLGLALVDHFSVWDERETNNIVVRPFEPHIPVSMGMILPKRRPLSIVAHRFIAVLRDLLDRGGSRSTAVLPEDETPEPAP
jgi:DNA-binding transcriptional LysR family regulator